jgi:hypothetical protein
MGIIEEDENSSMSRRRVVESFEWIIAIIRELKISFSTTNPTKNDLWKSDLNWFLIFDN